VHLVPVGSWCLIEDVAPEVYTQEFLGTTSLPDKAREALL
jgi:hypothetical protein